MEIIDSSITNYMHNVKDYQKKICDKWALLWFLKPNILGPKGHEKQVYHAPGKIVSLSLFKGLAKGKF